MSRKCNQNAYDTINPNSADSPESNLLRAAAVYFTRDHVLCSSFLHSFVTMAAISCAPTVRATAAPKVAIRRTNVRVAATGIRTQFGAVKGFAPVG